jgi:hypothetical protein
MHFLSSACHFQSILITRKATIYMAICHASAKNQHPWLFIVRYSGRVQNTMPPIYFVLLQNYRWWPFKVLMNWDFVVGTIIVVYELDVVFCVWWEKAATSVLIIWQSKYKDIEAWQRNGIIPSTLYVVVVVVCSEIQVCSILFDLLLPYMTTAHDTFFILL